MQVKKWNDSSYVDYLFTYMYLSRNNNFPTCFVATSLVPHATNASIWQLRSIPSSFAPPLIHFSHNSTALCKYFKYDFSIANVKELPWCVGSMEVFLSGVVWLVVCSDVGLLGVLWMLSPASFTLNATSVSSFFNWAFRSWKGKVNLNIKNLQNGMCHMQNVYQPVLSISLTRAFTDHF